MSRHALIDAQQAVVNVIEIASTEGWAPPNGTTIVMSSACATAQIGSSWNGSVFSLPPSGTAYPLAGDYQRCRNYYTSSSIDSYLASTAPTNAESIAALKDTINALRSTLAILRASQ